MPGDMKRGLLVPIPKGSSDPSIRENNRGISLLTTFYKQFQSLLIGRFGPHMENKISTVQGAGRKKISCTHTSLLVRETIAFNLEENRKVFVALLDVKKAYDTVWSDGLKYKLLKSGIDYKLYKILVELLDDFQCAIFVANEMSEWFTLRQGIPQGAPLSLWMYEIFMNDLIQEIIDCKLGSSIGDIHIACPAYADDMTIITTHHTNMQNILSKAYKHSRKWRYNFSANKSEILIYGQDKRNYHFWLGNEKVPNVEFTTHLGTCLYKNKKHLMSFLEKKVYKGNQAIMSVQGLGSTCAPTSVKLQSKIYWAVSVPIITYGQEVMEANDSCLNYLDDNHWKIAKKIQRLPYQTPDPTVLPLLGWMSLSSYVHFLQLSFLWRVLLLPVRDIYRKITMARILHYCESERMHKGPIVTILDTAKKYNVLQYILYSMLNGFTLTNVQWKKKIKTIIKERECQRHIATLSMYKGTKLFLSAIKTPQLWTWWEYASRNPKSWRKCKNLAQFLTGYRRYHEFFNRDKICNVCLINSECPLTHILFECTELITTRENHWNTVRQHVPAPFIETFEPMQAFAKTCFIMNGMNSKFSSEFEAIYEAILMFVNSMFEERTNLVI
jgi:hypothetical protein